MRIFNPNRGRLFLSSLVVFTLVLSSCSAGEKFEKRQLSIQGRNGTQILTVEIAETEAQRNQGLMHRKTLKDGAGMLFVFERDQILSFWMKNTLIPLSIAYISYDGTITDIRDMYPKNESSVHSSRSVRYALEVPQGWFEKVGVKAGDKVIL